jgi:nucleotide-binding universal stress UspA family protein
MSQTAPIHSPMPAEPWQPAESASDQFWRAQTTAGAQSSACAHQRAANHAPGEKGIRRILVPTDFSTGSARAIERAVAIANQCSADVTILHVVDINTQVEAGECDAFMRRIWDEGSSQMGQLALSLSGRVEARTMVEQGLAWETIIEKSRDFDLVVLGQSERRSSLRLFSQHTAQRVMENAACPVMVVPPER